MGIEKVIQVRGIPLIKFGKMKWVKKLQEGNLHFQSLKVYRDMAKKSTVIGDDYEAALHINEAEIIIQPKEGGNTTKYSINNELLKTSHSNDFAFCIFGVNPKQEQFQFDAQQKSEMLEFGDTALIVKDSDEFYKRIRSAFVKQSICLEKVYCGFVTYFDESVDSVNVIAQLLKGMHNVAFQKRNKYKYQQEFRIVVENDDSEIAYLDLDIGDISDITEIVSSQSALNGIIQKSLYITEEQNNG